MFVWGVACPAKAWGRLILNLLFMKNRRFTLFLLVLLLTARWVYAAPSCIVVSGHPGDAAFGAAIEASSHTWLEAAKKAGYASKLVSTGLSEGEASQLERLRGELAAVETPSQDPLWLVFTGHGNAQGSVPRFALMGADLGADELSALLGKIKRPMVLVLGFSCSGAFVKSLAASDRQIIAATRSGEEENWTRFPKFFAEAISGLKADLDGDGQVSVFEAWISAVDAVEGFYKDAGRLVTEHAVLDDSGQGKPEGRAAFNRFGEYAGKKADSSAAPGVRARDAFFMASPIEAVLSEDERAKRSRLEGELARLRSEKAGMGEEAYRKALETVFVGLAGVYEGARKRLPSE